ncbi:MAG: hypothetical protein EXR51_06235 [Dehalococcoidia bacterium]|nr:hypothetical protein [Dehalococcoidia bacterium]
MPTRLSLERCIRLAASVTIAGSLAALLALPGSAAGTAAPEVAAPSIPFTEVNPLGANFFLDREVEPWKRDLTVRMAKAAGIGWMKQMFLWEEIEPRRNYFIDDEFKVSTWKKYDEIVDLAEKYGLKVIARIDRPPSWTRRDNRYPTAPPDSIEDYANFVQTVVSRYKGRINYYQVWNEPNLWPEWGDRPVDPAGYAAMLRLAYVKAKAVDPGVVIISAPLGQTVEDSQRNLSDLTFLEALYRAGAKGYFDILAANGYGFDAPPDESPDPGRLNFSRLKLLRAIMVRNGDEAKPIWLNEFGWNASPSGYPPQKLVWGHVSEAQQARYTVEAVKLARSWGWVGVMNTWYFRQVGDIPVTRSDYFFRMVDTDFTPRRVFHEVQGLALELQVAGPGVYQATSAAVSPGTGWTERVAAGGSPGRTLSGPRQDSRITIRLRGSDLAITATGGAAPARVRVVVDGGGPSLATLLLGAVTEVTLPPATSGLTMVPIVSGLIPGVHTVTLEQVSGDPWSLTTFTVESKASPVQTVALGGLAGLATIVLAASVIRSRRRS